MKWVQIRRGKMIYHISGTVEYPDGARKFCARIKIRTNEHNVPVEVKEE